MLAEYIRANSAKRSNCHQFRPRESALKQQKWQTLNHTLPLLTSSCPIFPSDSRPDICPWIIIGQCGLRLFR